MYVSESLYMTFRSLTINTKLFHLAFPESSEILRYVLKCMVQFFTLITTLEVHVQFQLFIFEAEYHQRAFFTTFCFARESACFKSLNQ